MRSVRFGLKACMALGRACLEEIGCKHHVVHYTTNNRRPSDVPYAYSQNHAAIERHLLRRLLKIINMFPGAFIHEIFRPSRAIHAEHAPSLGERYLAPLPPNPCSPCLQGSPGPNVQPPRWWGAKYTFDKHLPDALLCRLLCGLRSERHLSNMKPERMWRFGVFLQEGAQRIVVAYDPDQVKLPAASLWVNGLPMHDALSQQGAPSRTTTCP
jgi:hypothetical protein